MKSVFFFLLSFFITYLSIPLLKKLAFRFNIVDLPGGRKIHQAPTPLLGGMAIYLSLIIGFALNISGLSSLLPIILGMSIIVLLGLINDIRELSAKLRLFVQALAGLVVVAGGLRISFFPNIMRLPIIDIAVTLIWIVGVTNAFNCLDGLDGLATGLAVVNSLCFIVILYMTGQYGSGLFLIMLIGACLAFLPHNFRKDKIFLGEAGSTLLGFTLACMAFTAFWAKDNLVKVSIPVLILGVPIFDMIFTTFMRIKEGKVKTFEEWLGYAGKDHFHHFLVDLGLSPRGAVLFIYFISLSLGISAIMVSNDRAFEAFLALSQATIIFVIIAILIVVGKRRHSGWSNS